ncbi:ABC-2 type transporter [compost metagenome]
MARFLLELGGTTLAFLIVYLVLVAFGQVGWPADPLLLYYGWISLFILSVGIALVVSALAMEFDVVERIVPVLMYAILPFSGAFSMAAWLPPTYREIYLAVPIPHPVEMMRAGVFGEFVETHYDPLYPLFWGGLLTVLGLIMISRAKEHIDAD